MITTFKALNYLKKILKSNCFSYEELTEINNKLDELKAITCNKMIEKSKED